MEAAPSQRKVFDFLEALLIITFDFIVFTFYAVEITTEVISILLHLEHLS